MTNDVLVAALRRLCVLYLLLSLRLLFVYSQNQLQAGYAVVTPGGGAAPVATALFSFTDPSGTLLWEAGVGAVEPIRSGRIFVERTPTTRTALALANPSTSNATVTLILRDAAGLELGRTIESFGAGQHRARFLEELPLALPADFSSGSLTFVSDQKLAAITLRENKNARGESIYATLPVVDLAAAVSTQPIVFPQIAVGSGYSTQLVLLNRTLERSRGRVRLLGSDGVPLQLAGGSEIAYDIAPQGTYRAELAGAGSVQVGYAVVTLESGSAIPSGSAIFQVKAGLGVITEAGVAATASTRLARIFVDNASTRTGLALASAGNPATTATLALLDRNGNALATSTLGLAAGGHRARFVHELFPDLAEGFSGLLEISCPVPIVPITLKLTTNARNETVLTTLPVADLGRPPLTRALVFPQIAFGSGFSTRLIFINSDKTQSLAGTLQFYQSSGALLMLPLGGQSASQFAYQVAAGAGRQLRPGNTASVQKIFVDPAQPDSSEIPVNEGGTLELAPLALDSSGTVRDDFAYGFASTNPAVATVDASGKIQAKKAGFSTLTISSSGVVATLTVVVARVTTGAGGFEIKGLVQDLARRIYLADSRDHTLLLADDIAKTPALYAGINQSPGLRNDLRLNSLFKNPAFLALNQADGALYVSDSGNAVIRRVRPGTSGRVETLVLDQTLNNPQGIALDNRGFLWVADSGNHVVRRINLVTGSVQTIAGKIGAAGLADGAGDQARFSSPAGLALEPESLAEQLEREGKGLPPPPVRVIVADTGNGRLRRVRENGQVETIGSASAGGGQSSALRLASRQSPAASFGTAPLILSSPSGVTVDPLGNIYVTEPGAQHVKILLTSGELVPAAEGKNFTDPVGIFIDALGQFIVGGSKPSSQRINYGPPEILSITPGEVSNRGGTLVTVQGSNFSSDTRVVAAGVVVSAVQVRDTETLSFVAPALPSGLTTLTVQNRAGLAQKSFSVTPTPLASLSAASITTVAGGTTFTGEGLPATQAALFSPKGLAFDSAGNLFIADTENGRLRRVDSKTGIITTVAGTGLTGLGDTVRPGVLATASPLRFPEAVAVDGDGNVYISGFQSAGTHKVDSRTGIITTVVTNSAQYLAVDAEGNLYLSYSFDNRIRKVAAGTKTVTVVAGNGQSGFSGDNGPALQASLSFPNGIAVDSAGNLFIADGGNNRVRRVDALTGIITTVAGSGRLDSGGDGGPATAAGLLSPSGLAFDGEGNLYIVSGGGIRRLDARTGVITTQLPFYTTQLPFATGYIATDATGNLYFPNTRANQVVKADFRTQNISVVAGRGIVRFTGDGGLATTAALFDPKDVALDDSGNIYIVDSRDQRIRKVDSRTGIITTVAGNGEIAYIEPPNGSMATQVGMFFPSAVVVDHAGNIYFGEAGIKKVDVTTGRSSTAVSAGNLTNNIKGLILDSAGNLIFAGGDFARVTKFDFATKTLSTIAGNGSTGFSGDNGPATQASINVPQGIALDSAGNLFIADSFNRRIRKVNLATGIITTHAILESAPSDVAADSAGNVFALLAFSIVRIDAQTGVVKTIARTRGFGFAGDNGPALDAGFFGTAITLDPAGNLFLTDKYNGRVRAIKGPIQ